MNKIILKENEREKRYNMRMKIFAARGKEAVSELTGFRIQR
jgi:hypothetical protein